MQAYPVSISRCRKWNTAKGMAYSNGSRDVLSKKDALSLNDEEVDEFMNITDGGINSLTGQRVVLAGSQLRCKAVTEDGLSSNLGEHGSAQDHPCELEEVSDNVKVSNGKDYGNDAGVGNT